MAKVMPGDAAGTSGSAGAPTRVRVSTGEMFRVRHFGLIWLSGLIWHLSRWGVSFLGSYLVNDLTGSPRLVQLTGSMLFAPLLVGGVLGGVVSDRFDRLRTVRVQLATLIPLTVVIGLLVQAGRIEVWMIYLYMFVVGIGWVTDMTSRRAMVFDVVGPSRIGTAMALESVSMSSGAVIGSLVGGTAVDLIGVWAAYLIVAGMLALGLAVLVPVTSPAVAPGARPAGPARPLQDLREGVRVLRSNRGVMSILGVTVVANFFLFAYFPIVPVVAKNLGARPFQVGLLVAGANMGTMASSLAVARTEPVRRGLIYVVGVAAATVMLFPFALARTYLVAFVALVLLGIGGGLFGSTQSALVMAESPEHLRGRALGMLSMAIGALPVGMYVLGETAQRLGVTEALVIHASIGLACLVAWVITHPSVHRITA